MIIDAVVYYIYICNSPPVVRCIVIITLVVIELPLPPIGHGVVIAVCEDIVIVDVVVCASIAEAEAILCIVLHPVAGDVVVARR